MSSNIQYFFISTIVLIDNLPLFTGKKKQKLFHYIRMYVCVKQKITKFDFLHPFLREVVKNQNGFYTVRLTVRVGPPLISNGQLKKN